jgi:hypothetical protein
MTPDRSVIFVRDLLQLVFIAAWVIGLLGWAWAFWHFMPMWFARFRTRDEHKGFTRKVLLGTAVFAAAFCTGWGAMALGEVLNLPPP